MAVLTILMTGREELIGASTHQERVATRQSLYRVAWTSSSRDSVADAGESPMTPSADTAWIR